MNNTINSCDVSIILLNYNSAFERIKFTLDSILGQINIAFEIIICDDGSKNNWFNEISTYMKQHNFTDYKLIGTDKNGGTVLNLGNGLTAASGRFVKCISPGDALISKTILSDWLQSTIKSGKAWSFCDVINYRRDSDGRISVIRANAYPQNIHVYKTKNDKACRWNYAVLNDIAVGAAILCERKVLLYYYGLISKKVVFAEDNMFRIMMFAGEVAHYYPENGIMYEFGDGVSTSGNEVWSKRLKADWEAADRIMIDEVRYCDSYQLKMRKVLVDQYDSDGIKKRIKHYFTKGRIAFLVMKKIFPRMTDYIGWH
jgi:glycosyltransferase involved in cell wall biosynthesis